MPKMTVAKRQHRVNIVLNYLGDQEPKDVRESIVAALVTRTGDGTSEHAAVSHARTISRTLLEVSVVVSERGATDALGALGALSQIDDALLDSLMLTGLFEEFEISRRVLHVGPADLLDQPWHEPFANAVSAALTADTRAEEFPDKLLQELNAQGVTLSQPHFAERAAQAWTHADTAPHPRNRLGEKLASQAKRALSSLRRSK